MAHRRAYYLYKRHKKGGDYWYVCFLDKETGKAGNAKSIDSLKERLGIMDFEKTVRKEDAAIIASKALEKGILTSQSVMFSSWCKDFWDWDKSEYIHLKNNIREGSIGKEYAYNMKKNFEKNVEPLLPKGLELTSVTVSMLDRIVKELYKTKSSRTVSIIIYSFSLPLKEAVRLGKISTNPSDKLLKVNGTEKERGVLEKKELMALREKLESKKNSLFPSYYYGVLLALCTGMRISEIRALRTEDIILSSKEGFHKILIRHSVAYLSGLKSTKGKYERAVLINSELASSLIANASSSGVILPSSENSKEYISVPTLRNVFYDLLESIGISEEERKRRNITFHSLRHTFSTIGRDENISQEDRMLVLGHKSERVNDRYTHETDNALKRVSVLTEAIWRSAEKSAEA